ncbi:MAG: membrane dipeptidase [Bacteroidales bacterium]|nr:membrane dipeptidase [Bacteroidales bacterium]MCB8999288.1 membrane dipeptidase [Bacteroidales bacterium]MCB9013042.1 membrane dipeptidase [Bacteroidales bacterium]
MKKLKILFLSALIIAGGKLYAVKVPSAKKIQKVHDKAITIDSHTDTPMWFLRDNYSFGEYHNSKTERSKVDLPRMEMGDLDGIFLAVFIGQAERDEKGNLAAKDEALQIFDSIESNLRRYSDKIELALNPEDIYSIRQKGKRAAFIGMENGYPIGKELSLIDTFYELGARYITLCHSSNNDICDSSTDKKGPEHGGVSDFGKEVIEKMNYKGIMVDVSHVSDSSFYDAIRISKAPVIASHSCARALCDNPRNMTDDMLRALAKNGGVIQMCILSAYVKTPVPQPERDSARTAIRKQFGDYYSLSDSARKEFMNAWFKLDEDFPPVLATVSDVVDHIDHIVAVAGIDHVGIGTDFDGGGGVEGCNDVSEMKNITAELLRRGYNQKEIDKIWGGNLLRVFGEVQKVSKSLQENPM